jgi:hypothetical protein
MIGMIASRKGRNGREGFDRITDETTGGFSERKPEEVWNADLRSSSLI